MPLCVECEAEPLTPGHYCPCCGRKLSVEERKALESNPIVAGGAPGAASGPASDAPRGVSAAAAALPRPVSTKTASVSNGKPPAGQTNRVASSAAKLQEARVAAARARAVRAAEAQEEAARAEAAKAAAARAIAAKVVADRVAAAAKNEAFAARRLESPTLPSPPPAAPVQSRRANSLVLTAAVVVMFGAIAALQGDRWLGGQGVLQTARDARVAQPTPVVAGMTGGPVATPSDASASVTGPAPGGGAAPAKPAPKPSAGTGGRASATTRQPTPPAPQAAPIAARQPVTNARAPKAAPPPTPPVAAAPPPAAAPTGRIFESTDVDRAPKVTNRVEPRLPTNLPADTLDVVVVRVLVSETGQPFRISVLRGSRLGQTLDDAVVEAVKQWTFAPALKKGEAVHSWYNIGVPLGRAG